MVQHQIIVTRLLSELEETAAVPDPVEETLPFALLPWFVAVAAGLALALGRLPGTVVETVVLPVALVVAEALAGTLARVVMEEAQPTPPLELEVVEVVVPQVDKLLVVVSIRRPVAGAVVLEF